MTADKGDDSWLPDAGEVKVDILFASVCVCVRDVTV